MSRTVLFTGFPGFLGSALLPRTLRRSPDAAAVALVQERWLDQARRTLERLETAEPEIAGRTRLVVGDITRPDLGLDAAEADALRAGPLEIFHLAAVYDLSVPADLAWSVNVDGTRHVVDLARSAGELVRLQYVSTATSPGATTGSSPRTTSSSGRRSPTTTSTPSTRPSASSPRRARPVCR
ncbi:SDR family oxidoreductase [Actinomycetospora sp. OC33-EN06]|uniref:SDR family oxidoreductase n=1 Tax=Actinomycetospora aeridis TaxID=3129231 RepID=A0ABU8MXP5_9PSEU